MLSLWRHREKRLCHFLKCGVPAPSVMVGFLFHMRGSSGVTVLPSWWGLCICSQSPSNVGRCLLLTLMLSLGIWGMCDLKYVTVCLVPWPLHGLSSAPT